LIKNALRHGIFHHRGCDVGHTGSAGTLSNSSFTTVATSDANVSALSTNSLTFTLAAKSTIHRAGAYTIAATWKFESI
jgi:hypothetical protein